MEQKYLIIRIDPYMGEDTYLQCGTFDEDGVTAEQPLYQVFSAATGEFLDGGYRSFREASEIWPDAINLSASGNTDIQD